MYVSDLRNYSLATSTYIARTHIADDTRNGGRIESPRQEQISKKGKVDTIISKP